jgi:hypothetical protein
MSDNNFLNRSLTTNDSDGCERNGNRQLPTDDLVERRKTENRPLPMDELQTSVKMIIAHYQWAN